MREFERVIGIPGLSNLGIVDRYKVYRCAQPAGLVGLQSLKEYGVRYILNLQEWPDETEVAFKDIIQIPFRVNVFSNITVDDFNLLIETLSDLDKLPILVHCLQGHDRTGVVCAAYRIAVDGWTYAEAKEEMIAYGWNPLWIPLEHKLQDFAKSKGIVV